MVYVERVPQAPAGPSGAFGLLYALEHRYEAAVPRCCARCSPGRATRPPLRGYLVEALRGRARELSAEGNATEADQLLAEASSSRVDDAPTAAASHPCPLLVSALGGAAFLPSLQGQFLDWDDSVNFVANPHYRGLGWGHRSSGQFSATLMGHYIPVT